MLQTNTFRSLLTLIMGIISASVFLTGCDDVKEAPNPPYETFGCYEFKDASGIGLEYMHPDESGVQCFQYDSNEQTITLKLKSVLKPEIETPTNLLIDHLDEWKEGFTAQIVYNKTNMSEFQSDGCYHIWTDHENGEPVIKINLMKNDTGSTRHIGMHIISYPGQSEVIKIDKENYVVTYGAYVEIIQLPIEEEPETFSLKAQYKGREYQTEASLDEEGNLIFANPEYTELMQTIDATPGMEMMVLDSETFYYYDADDINNNMPYHDIMALKPGAQTTRATGFEDFEYDHLGYVALYDNDHFEGKHISKGLDNFHFTWNLPNLKEYDMNDKVTSIAAVFNSDDPLVCTVLTIWDDSDYNYGDKYRSKHRISIVACSQAPFVAVEDLKKVKKIGSSKSWNDCISSISFHFGYIDRLLLDY